MTGSSKSNQSQFSTTTKKIIKVQSNCLQNRFFFLKEKDLEFIWLPSFCNCKLSIITSCISVLHYLFKGIYLLPLPLFPLKFILIFCDQSSPLISNNDPYSTYINLMKISPMATFNLCISTGGGGGVPYILVLLSGFGPSGNNTFSCIFYQPEFSTLTLTSMHVWAHYFSMFAIKLCWIYHIWCWHNKCEMMWYMSKKLILWTIGRDQKEGAYLRGP